MGVLVVVVEGGGDVSLSAPLAEGLAELGVTSVSLNRDAAGAAFVLEGWAFDVDRFGDDAAALLAFAGSGSRSLRPVMRLSITRSAPAGQRTTAHAEPASASGRDRELLDEPAAL